MSESGNKIVFPTMACNGPVSGDGKDSMMTLSFAVRSFCNALHLCKLSTNAEQAQLVNDIVETSLINLTYLGVASNDPITALKYGEQLLSMHQISNTCFLYVFIYSFKIN